MGLDDMTRHDAEKRLKNLAVTSADAVFALGLDLLKADHPELLLPTALVAAERHPANPRIQQLLGLTARALGESRIANSAFACAAALAPADPLIAHSHARAALEAGADAIALFDRAAQLAPGDGAVLLGRAAARIDQGQAAEAAAELAAIIEKNALWLDGQRALAHLRGELGLDPTKAIEHALRAHPKNPSLHLSHITINLEACRLAEAERAARSAIDSLGDTPWVTEVSAHIASEAADIKRADQLFDRAGPPAQIGDVANRVRHLIRAGRPERASELIDRWIDRDPDRLLWPYRALVWRMLGDARAAWLEGDARFVGVYDLANRIGNLSALADHVRERHFARSAPLDQSVRGGTQTDGNLLIRDEAPLSELRALILDTVRQYVAQLPPADVRHPTLLAHRDPLRIAGSWSVRLQGEGFHTDHVHSQGWISSAFYIALPDLATTMPGAESHPGWLTLGTSRDLAPGLPPVQLVEPKPGRLVLFPSTMWHGTRPFLSGERMTVAFDIARPNQG
jgi:predicted Zn-dependent protease